MKTLSRILFPLVVTSIAASGAFNLGSTSVEAGRNPVSYEVRDTVLYPVNGYKIVKELSEEELKARAAEAVEADSTNILAPKVISPRDSLKALLDSSLWDKLDSIYIADSTAKAKAKFDAWYNGLSKAERKRYDADVKAKMMTARMDSLRKVKEKEQEVKDSIAESVPRILETFAIPDSMQYKRVIAWHLDPDFQKMDLYVPDTSYNYHFYDYPFQRNDVNATWLGVAGSPVQYYDYTKRGSEEGVDFYAPQESWSISPRTIPHYNSKTPYTELAYYGTLLAGDEKESDNLHIFTTQNITPEFNFSLLYDRFGGGGMLENEEVTNKTAAVAANYLGKRYTMHAGYISNTVSRKENGGIVDIGWIRDTTVDARDIEVALGSAKSKIKKSTFFLDQQLRIPFNFIEKIKASRDSTYKFNSDSLVRDVTTAFIGHSSEFSTYTRKYTDAITDQAGKDFYNDTFYYDDAASADSLRVMKLDNKVFMRLQPWSSQGVVSKLDVGAGDLLLQYFDSTSLRPQKHTENSLYVYAGAEGQVRSNIFWDAKARYFILGSDFGDFSIEGNARLDLYPFRRHRGSPVSLSAHFGTSLEAPNYYQEHISTNHFKWDNDFSKVSTTRISGDLEIPQWNLSASVGYTLTGNTVYYDTLGIAKQYADPMSVLSASLRKEFVLGPLHLDNRVLLQTSSNQDVIPVPTAAFNLKYFLQFVVQRDESKKNNVMVMQIGANAFYNTKWYSPAWNPNIGVFHNQNKYQYNNGPYFDVFVNVQWKRACIFIKYQNAGGGWPMKKSDYFSADRYVVTGNGLSGLKLGIFWPFYTQPRGQAPLNP